MVRLTKGEDAESRYRAAMKKRKQHEDDDDGGGGGGEERGGLDPKKKAPLLRLEADQFNLLRLESDKFVNGDDDIYTRPTMRPRGEPHAVAAGGGRARVEGGTTKGEHDEDPSGWYGPLPEQAVLVADGFLVPGKSDGGVYIVIPDGDGQRKRRDGAARTEESGDRQSGGGVGGEGIIRLTSAKRLVELRVPYREAGGQYRQDFHGVPSACRSRDKLVRSYGTLLAKLSGDTLENCCRWCLRGCTLFSKPEWQVGVGSLRVTGNFKATPQGCARVRARS